MSSEVDQSNDRDVGLERLAITVRRQEDQYQKGPAQGLVGWDGEAHGKATVPLSEDRRYCAKCRLS
jgi:hypothetical protein